MKLKRKLRREAAEQAKKQPKRLSPLWKKILSLIGAFLLVFAIYQLGCKFRFEPILPIYGTVTGVLFLVYATLCRGFSVKPVTPEQLSDQYTPEEKEKYIADDTRRKEKAKTVLIWLFAFALTLLIDMIYLFYIF